MKTGKTILIMLMGLITMSIICSCDANKQKVNETVTEFFHALNHSDTTLMCQYYPDVNKLSDFYKSDSIIITKTEKQKNGEYYVEVKNLYEDEEFDSRTNVVTLILAQVDSTNEQTGFKIKNSIGLVDYSKKYLYRFANLVGCFDPYFPETDVETSGRIEDVMGLYLNYVHVVSRNIRDNVKIEDYVDIGPTPGFVEITARIGNYSEFDVRNIKYRLHFYDRSYHSDDEEGHIFPEGLRSGSSNVATIRTGYIGVKSIKMFFDLDFESEEIFKCIYQIPFKGNEYRKYLKNKEEQ